jgi:hypothetical protein
MIGIGELAHPVGDELELSWHESPPLAEWKWGQVHFRGLFG